LYFISFNEISLTLFRNSQNFLYHSWIDNLDILDTLKIIGIYIYHYNFIYLIIGSLILIVAMLGAIILTLEKKKYKK